MGSAGSSMDNDKAVAAIALTVAMFLLWPRRRRVAEFELSDLVIHPLEVYPGEEVTISVRAGNMADIESTGDIPLYLGGEVVQTKTITLLPGESRVVSFAVAAGTPGTYEVTVDGLSGAFTVLPIPEPDIQLSNLVIDPQQAYPGDEVTISVTATNYGDAEGSKTITFEVI